MTRIISHCTTVIDGRAPPCCRSAQQVQCRGDLRDGDALSDNYGPDGDSELIGRSRKRAEELATNPALNAIARSKVAFRPVELSADTAAVYRADIDGKTYAAFFNFARTPGTLSLEAIRGSIPAAGRVKDLNRGVE